MHTEILLLAGTVSSGFLILSVTRGLKMRDEKRPLAELLWYAGGLLPLAGVCLYWTSIGGQPVMAQRIVLLIVGAIIGGCALAAAGEFLRPQPIVLGDASTPTSLGPGGPGGKATVIGRHSGAEGGFGGEGGLGPGGPGGDATVTGDHSFARGGDGGNAGQPDGRGGKRTLGPAQRLGLPTSLWKYGYGGHGGDTPEYTRRLNLLRKIRAEFIQQFPDDAPYIDAGIDAVPAEWVNKRLEEIGENWRIALGDGGYILPPLEPKKK